MILITHQYHVVSTAILHYIGECVLHNGEIEMLYEGKNII